MTIKRRFKDTKPRVELARQLGISAPYACDIAAGEPIGSTKTFAKMVHRLGLDPVETDASLREMFPEEFTGPVIEIVASVTRPDVDAATEAA